MKFNNVSGILPCYGPYGENGCTVIFEDGSSIFYDCPIKVYIQALIINDHQDPRTLSEWTRRCIGGKINLPITLKSDLIFIPIKVRHTLVKDHACFGYVNSAFIQSIYKNKIILKNDVSISTLSSMTYINNKQKDAALLGYLYNQHKAQYDFMHHYLSA